MKRALKVSLCVIDLPVFRGCSDCEGNATDCRESYGVPADGVQRVMLSVNRKLPGTAVHVSPSISHLPASAVSRFQVRMQFSS
jgi:hypothetical protein